MNKEREDYSPKMTATRIFSWAGLRLLNGAERGNWSSSWGLTSRVLALVVAQNDFWDKRREFQERELPEEAFGIWLQEIKPDSSQTFASFYKELIEGINAYPAEKRFLAKKNLASWQREICQLELEQAKTDLEKVNFAEGWQRRKETILVAARGITSLACGREIPKDDPKFLETVKLVLTAQVVDDTVGLGSDWNARRLTFATLALSHFSNEQEKKELIRVIGEGKYNFFVLAQKAPDLFNFLRKKANGYLDEVSSSSLRLKLAKFFLGGVVRYYPSGYELVKKERDKSSPLARVLEFFPPTPD